MSVAVLLKGLITWVGCLEIRSFIIYSRGEERREKERSDERG